MEHELMALHLKDLFIYPIERYIPPVAKVDDVAEATVEAELREYVVTAPIERALADFLEVYAESRTVPTDKIGVWISGFFGSGKSHFAKVLSYLLNNPTVGGRTARALFIERLAGSPRQVEIEGLLHRIGLLDSQVIMFQIKAEQDQTQRDESISEIMYRRYLARRGLSTDPVVASLELSLIERGLYDAFQAEVEKMIETQVTDDQFEQLVATLLPIDDEKTEGWQERTLQQQGEIKTLWFQSPTIGDFRGTAWGAVNAFSEWEQWMAPIRTKSNRAEVLADRTLRRTVMPMGKQVHKALVAAKVRNG